MDYWLPKLTRNSRRDRANRKAVGKMGLSVWRFWEHDLKVKRMVRAQMIVERRLKARLDLRKRVKKAAHDQVPAGWLRQGWITGQVGGRGQVDAGREMALCNDEAGILLGKLDSVPLQGTDLHLGHEFAVSYDKVVEHTKASDFEKQ